MSLWDAGRSFQAMQELVACIWVVDEVELCELLVDVERLIVSKDVLFLYD